MIVQCFPVLWRGECESRIVVEEKFELTLGGAEYIWETKVDLYYIIIFTLSKRTEMIERV